MEKNNKCQLLYTRGNKFLLPFYQIHSYILWIGQKTKSVCFVAGVQIHILRVISLPFPAFLWQLIFAFVMCSGSYKYNLFTFSLFIYFTA
jgi:hypothetical protein